QNWKSYIVCCKSEPWKDDLPNLLPIVGRVISHLMGDVSRNPYKDKKYLVPDHPDLSGHTDPNYHQLNELNNTRDYITPRRRKMREMKPADFEDPYKELFLWAILLNRRELAHLFWKLGKDHIGGALMGSALLKSLSEIADDEEEVDLAQDIAKHSESWEEIACGVLNECYTRDKQMSHNLLIRKLNTWGGTTLFSIAEEANKMDFMGLSCCQTKLNKIWKGNMALYTSNWKIFASLFLPFFLPLIKFSTNDFTTEGPSDNNLAQGPPESKGSKVDVQPLGNDNEEFVRSKSRRKRKRLTRKLYTVACGSGAQGSISVFSAIYYYHTAPVTKFSYHTISYIVFLGMFTFFLLTNLRPVTHPDSPSFWEMLVWGWAATMFVEELRQFLTKDTTSVKYKFSGYFSNLWNAFDQGIYIMLLISIILRYTLLDEEDFKWARRFYSITLAMFFVRFMHIFFVEKNLGPKVIMIRRMLTDLLFFIAILLVFILAYGVASQALRYPNAPVSWNLLKDIVYLPYWQMYGELELALVEGELEGCTSNETIWRNDPEAERCPEESSLAIILFAIYMMVSNVLLLNLLIALFSHTFEKVQENSEKVWRFYRYNLIYEYFDRPTLAPPLIILSHIARIIMFFIYACRSDMTKSHAFKKYLSKEEYNKLTAFERAGMEEYLLHAQQLHHEHIENKVSATGERIEKVIEDLEEIKEQVVTSDSSVPTLEFDQAVMVQQLGATPHEQPDPIERSELKGEFDYLNTRMKNLENKLASQSSAMEQILTLLQSSRHGGQAQTSPYGNQIQTAPYGGQEHQTSSQSSFYRPPLPHIEIQGDSLD
ncbi:unnamed protein product, partial [Owenia fusiformis]